MKKNYNLLILLTFMFSSFAYAQDPTLLATYNDIRRFDQIVSLDPALESSQVHIVEKSSNNDGYEVFATRKVTANIYGYITNDVGIINQNSDFYNSFGLFPVIDRYVSVSKKIGNNQEFNFKIPYSASDIEELNIGDAIYFQSTGGITMYLSLGISGFGLGPKFAIQGGFTTYIEKKEHNKVFVEIRKTNIKTYGLLAGTLGAFAETAILKELTKGVNFLIDLSTQEGRLVYENLIRAGRGDLAQESTSTVTRVGDVASQKTLKFTKFALATPIIPFIDIASSRVSETRSEQRSNIWEQNSSTIVYKKGKKRTKRIFSKKSETSKIFETIENATTGSIESASLTIAKIKSNYSTRSLVKAFRYFYRKTGITFFREIFLNFGGMSLGYANVEAKIELSKSAIVFVQKNYGDNTSAERFASLSRSFTKDDNFKNLLSIVKKCGGSLKLIVEGQRITRSVVEESFAKKIDCI